MGKMTSISFAGVFKTKSPRTCRGIFLWITLKIMIPQSQSRGRQDNNIESLLEKSFGNSFTRCRRFVLIQGLQLDVPLAEIADFHIGDQIVFAAPGRFAHDSPDLIELFAYIFKIIERKICDFESQCDIPFSANTIGSRSNCQVILFEHRFPF